MDRLPPLPAPPSPPPRTPFPLIAVIAPAVGAVVICLITGSMFVLVFAALSPLIAVATALDARRTARRHRRDEASRFDRDCTSWLARVPEHHALERARADAEHPPVTELLRAPAPAAPASPLRVGTAPGPSAIAPDAPPSPIEGASGERLTTLIAAAREHPALPVVVPAGLVRVVGHGRAAEAVARLVELHPGCTLVRDPGSTEVGDSASAIEILVQSPTRAVVRTADGRERAIRPEGAGLREVEAARHRRDSAAAPMPSAVSWSELAGEAARAGRPLHPGTIGAGADGPVVLDLVTETPHALVGGTTGSGKSELLRTLALSWAVGAAPRERSILLVDFKGGSAFAELDALPHVVGVITDLDARGAERALRSLRAEIRRRELLLVAHGVRDQRELAPGELARLLVLVDEYAALVETFPELQPLIADLAARGRSLGIHLVLCTQRPSGVVRDAVAANCGVRVAFRLASPADATGLLPGAGPAADAPAGRAIVASAGRVEPVQVATITTGDIAAVAARWQRCEPSARPWLPPLPQRVVQHELAELAALVTTTAEPRAAAIADATSDAATPVGPTAESRPPAVLPFGVLDDPDHQRRVPAVWSPRRDGALLVVGAEGSGAPAALAALADSARESGATVVVLPAALPDALGTLLELRDELESERSLLDPAAQPGGAGVAILVIPEIDALVAEAGDGALDLLDALDAVTRRLRPGGGALLASCSSVLRAKSGVVGRFDSVLLLRTASIDDHRAAGGAVADHDPDAPAGRGRWQGRAVQVVEPMRPLPRAREPRVDAWSPAGVGCVAVVSTRPRRIERALAAAGWATALDPRAAPTAATDEAALSAVIADAESWQSSWSALARVRREGVIVIADASEADARLVLGPRAQVPLRGPLLDEVIVVENGEPPRRVRWRALAAGAAPPVRRSG